MNFSNQSGPMSELNSLSKYNRQSILIDGPSGCGKTYLAHQYAGMLNISDIIDVKPAVQDIRDAVDLSYQVQSPMLMCIENLDTGVAGASHAILKCLEEPLPNLYIVATCRNIRKVPDTIVSRAAVVSVGPPISDDINLYAQSMNNMKYSRLLKSKIWKAVRSFGDVTAVINMSEDQLHYYESDLTSITFKDTISNIVWAIFHDSSGAELDPEFTLRFLMGQNISNSSFRQKCVDALKDLELNRLGTHAVLSKFAFECKYGE